MIFPQSEDDPSNRSHSNHSLPSFKSPKLTERLFTPSQPPLRLLRLHQSSRYLRSTETQTGKLWYTIVPSAIAAAVQVVKPSGTSSRRSFTLHICGAPKSAYQLHGPVQGNEVNSVISPLLSTLSEGRRLPKGAFCLHKKVGLVDCNALRDAPEKGDLRK